jgi:hypothetical protein
LRILLGSILLESSNVVVNGKGRRYRGGWIGRHVVKSDVDRLFEEAVDRCLHDLRHYGHNSRARSTVLKGDIRRLISRLGWADVAIFSPPYPNSFDYTDVYNIELWVLGYLSGPSANYKLRQSTLRSHVQTDFDRSVAKDLVKSRTLRVTVKALRKAGHLLWDRRIPDMVLAYFDDLRMTLKGLRSILRPGGRAIMVVGDSCYASVHIDVASVIKEIVPDIGFNLVSLVEIRSMRKSAQHGGGPELAETCIILERD